MSVNEIMNSGGARPYRRRKLIINPSLQWKYALTLGLAVFFVTSILSCTLFAALHEQARHRVMFPHSDTSNVGLLILLTAFGFSVLTAGVVGFWMVITTHRICGPLFLLDRYFRQLADGHLPKLRPLRRKDEFKELFRTFGHVVERIRGDRQAELNLVNKALVTAKTDPYVNEKECRKALDDVTRQLEDLRNMLTAGLASEPPHASRGHGRHTYGDVAGANPSNIAGDSGKPAPAHPKRTPVGVA